MVFPRLPFRSLLILAAVFGSAAGLFAELSSTSPFLPPGGQVVAAPTTPGQLEFRGAFIRPGYAPEFSIFDATKKSGAWVKLNEPGYDFSVKKYDPNTDTVTLEYQGRTLDVGMRTPKIASSGSAVAPPPGMVPSPIVNVAPNPSVRPNAVPNPTPPSDAARMAEWSAEIQRRRDMRNQAAGSTAGPQPAMTPVPQPAMVPQNQPQNSPANMRQQRANQRRN
jgi:hypothetical protein